MEPNNEPIEQVAPPVAHMYSKSEEGSSLTLILTGGKQLTLRDGTGLFDQAVKAYRERDWPNLYNLMQPARAIRAYMQEGDVTVKDGVVSYLGEPVANTVVDRIFAFLEEELDAKPIVRFLGRLMLNPSRRAVHELYPWAEHKGIPITEQGWLVGYRSLRNDCTDWYTGKILSVCGVEVRMPRNQVDDDCEIGCSYGYHIGTWEYAIGYNGGHKMSVNEFDPADVVSVPRDSCYQKLRTCAYTPLEIMDSPKSHRIDFPLYQGDNEDENDPEWEGETEDGNLNTDPFGDDEDSD